MAEGNKTFMGLAVPLFGEAEIQQQTAATDILTLTGAASQTGDFLVLQNSTGAELLVISSSGAITLVTGGMTFAGVIANTLSSTAANAVEISVTSTGAIAAGANTNNAILVDASSKSVLNAIIGYNSGGGSEVGSAQAFFAVHGSKAPSYAFSVGATAAGIGVATDNGFFEAATRFLTAPSTAITYGAVKMLAGSKVYYLLAIPDTSMVDT